MNIQTVTTDELFIINKVGTDFCTSSRIIADALEKRHDNVLQKIDKLLADIAKNQYADNDLKNKVVKQFDERIYVDEKGEERKEYYIKEEGFTQLMNSFADGGEKNARVLAWKIKFNEMFHKMKEILESKQEITVNAKNYIPPQEQTKIDIATKTIGLADAVYNYFGNKVDRGEILVASLQMAESNYDIDMSAIKRLAPPKLENFITATELTAQIEKDLHINIRGKGSKKTSTLNKFLEQQGYLIKIESKWTVTTKGERYGHLTPDNKHGKTFYNIAWSTRFIPIIEAEVQNNLQALI